MVPSWEPWPGAHRKRRQKTHDGQAPGKDLPGGCPTQAPLSWADALSLLWSRKQSLGPKSGVPDTQATHPVMTLV